MPKELTAFERDTLHRMATEAARYWVISHFLARKEIPAKAVWFAYPDGPVSFDWGNAPGPDDPQLKPLRRKRVRVTFEIEEVE